MLRIDTPFADYLTKEIGLLLKFTPVVDHAATVGGLVAEPVRMEYLTALGRLGI